jgi:hypothetical protein
MRGGFPWDLVALAVLLGVNRLAGPKWLLRTPFYVGVQFLDVVAIGLVLWFGLPGTQSYPVVKAFVAVVIAFHVVQNFAARGLAVQRVAEGRRLRGRVETAPQDGGALRGGGAPPFQEEHDVSPPLRDQP